LALNNQKYGTNGSSQTKERSASLYSRTLFEGLTQPKKNDLEADYENEVHLVDDSYWRKMMIEAREVCSYRFYSDQPDSSFELLFRNSSNMKIGLYHGKIDHRGQVFSVID
jgi:hypothetical protein